MEKVCCVCLQTIGESACVNYLGRNYHTQCWNMSANQVNQVNEDKPSPELDRCIECGYLIEEDNKKLYNNMIPD